MISRTQYKVTIELVEEMLGTVAKNREVFSNFIADKQREALRKDAKKNKTAADGEDLTADKITEVVAESEDSIAEQTPEEREERGWTGFHTDKDGKPFVFDYMVRGFMSYAALALKDQDFFGNGDKKLKAVGDKIKKYVFVAPRRIYLEGEFSVLERPLRAQTAQGPRVTVVRSDTLQAGAQLSFTLTVLDGSGLTEKAISGIMEYGEFQGLGQWRSGSYGRFRVVKFEKAK